MSDERQKDFVVVLPGIMGSTLARNGTLVWAPSAGSVLRAIATLGRSITSLQLPEGIGDGDPDDGVEPVGLMPDLHLLPRFWTPQLGYDELLRRLQALGFRLVSAGSQAPGNLLPAPYDWRLSNRHNGERLARLIQEPLEKWRAQGPADADAQVVLVCHSMGGLVARWYVERCGGAEVTRRIITLGTPYRGAPLALDALTRDLSRGIGRFGIDLTGFARSLPSLHQLLPAYACVDTEGQLATLEDTVLTRPIAELDTARLRDAMAFYRDLEAAEHGRPDARLRYPIVGSNQTTPSTVRIGSSGDVTLVDGYLAEDPRGDGTVPSVSAPLGLPLDDPTFHHVVDQHTNLPHNAAALDELEQAITASSTVPLATEQVTVDLVHPEFITSGEPLPIELELGESRRGVVVSVVDESGGRVVREPRVIGGRVALAIDGLAPGAHTVEVTGISPGQVTPVTGAVLVWPAEAEVS